MIKDVLGYEGLYTIDDKGQVYSNYKGGRTLKKVLDPDGYETVCLHKDGKQRNQRVHRLVAKAFIGDNDSSMSVNHKDGNKLNNAVDNLEWMTFADNNKHAYKNGLKNNSLENLLS
jgi:hypothetical protein